MAIDGVKIIDSDDGHDIYNLMLSAIEMALVLIQLFQKFWLKSRIFVLTNSIQKFIGSAVAYSLYGR